MRLLILAATLALAGQPSFANAATVERLVYLNRVPSQRVGYVSTDLGPIAGLVLGADQTHANRELLERYELMKQALPGLDLRQFAIDGTRCLPIAGEASRCVDPVFLDGDGGVEPTGEHQPGDVVQSIFISLDYNRLLAMKGGMTFWFTLDEATFGADGKATHRFLQVFYWDPPEKGHKGSPFGSDEAARQYWLEGSPSRFETSVRRAFADFAGIAQLYYPHSGERDFDPLKSDWGKSLAKLGELKQQGVVACRWAECRRPYLKLDGDRVWILPESMPPTALFQSVPLTLWN